jgi:1,4-alpha-glucan branching enzyme
LRADADSDVFVAGSFNDWDPTRTRLTWKRGVYAATVRLAQGRYEYKFIVDGTWCMDPDCPDWAPNGFGSLNSVITVE